MPSGESGIHPISRVHPGDDGSDNVAKGYCFRARLVSGKLKNCHHNTLIALDSEMPGSKVKI